MRGYLPFIWKDSFTHKYSLAVYAIPCNIDGFSQSVLLLIYLSLKTLMSITRTGEPTLADLVNLVNSFIFLFQTNWLLSQITKFHTRIPDLYSTVLLLQICFYLPTLVFVLRRFFLYWGILTMLFLHFPSTFLQTHPFLCSFWFFLCWLRLALWLKNLKLMVLFYV